MEILDELLEAKPRIGVDRLIAAGSTKEEKLMIALWLREMSRMA